MFGTRPVAISRPPGTGRSAVLPIILIIFLVFSEIAFTLLALSGQESLRWMSEAARERSVQWSDVINRASYLLNLHRAGYSQRNPMLSDNVTAALIQQLQVSLEKAEAADRELFEKKFDFVQRTAIKLFGLDTTKNLADSRGIQPDALELINSLASSDPDMVPALAARANTATLFDIHSRNAIAPVTRTEEEIASLLTHSAQVVGFVTVGANLLAIFGIWAIWRFLMRPGLIALQEALRSRAHSETRLRTILLSIGDAIIATDKERRIIEINDEARLLTGWEDNLAHQRRLEAVLNLVDSDLPALLKQVEARTAGAERPVRKVTRAKVRSRSSVERPLALTLTPVRQEGGAFDGLVLAFRDISDELAIQDMIIHREKAQLLERLSGSVAHDFNNLLAVILGNASLIAGASNLNARQEASIQAILRSGRAGAELATQLLSLSRPRSGKLERMALHEAIASVVSMARLVLTGGRTIEVRSRSDVHVLVDGASLKIAFLNVLMNAIEATKDSGRIVISYESDTFFTPDKVTIQFRDDEIGIAPDLLAEVTKPFFTTKASIKGTGLGLSSTIEFLERAGGSLRIQSSVGVGTSVFMTLPIADDAPAGRSTPAEAPARADGEDLNILVLDDRAELAETVSKQLIAMGHRASATMSAGAAEFEPDKIVSFDVVVCDVQLGGASGFDVHARLARTLGASCPPFVFITGNISEPRSKSMAQAGNYRILLKPFDISELLAAVNEVRTPPRK